MQLTGPRRRSATPNLKTAGFYRLHAHALLHLMPYTTARSSFHGAGPGALHHPVECPACGQEHTIYDDRLNIAYVVEPSEEADL